MTKILFFIVPLITPQNFVFEESFGLKNTRTFITSDPDDLRSVFESFPPKSSSKNWLKKRTMKSDTNKMTKRSKFSRKKLYPILNFVSKNQRPFNNINYKIKRQKHQLILAKNGRCYKRIKKWALLF